MSMATWELDRHKALRAVAADPEKAREDSARLRAGMKKHQLDSAVAVTAAAK